MFARILSASDPVILIYSTGLGACGVQSWGALARMYGMWEPMDVLAVISYNALSSTCEKGNQRQRVLAAEPDG